jgi:hypothetical protein
VIPALGGPIRVRTGFPGPGQRCDLRRDHSRIPGPLGTLTTVQPAGQPAPACPAGVHDRHHDGDPPQHIQAAESHGRSPAAEMRAAPQGSKEATNRTPEG